MKGKRRHELQTNVLADWLGHKVEKIRPAFGWILAGGVLVVLGLLAYSFFSSRSKTQMYDGWANLNRAQEEAITAIHQDKGAKFQDAAKAMERIVTDFAGTPLAMFAQSALGDVHLIRGQTLNWTRRPEALESFKSAAEHYTKAIAATEDPMLKNRLRMSLGTALEWKYQLDESKKVFHEVEEGIYRPAAQEQLAALTQAVDDKLFASLEKYQPPPPESPTKQGDTEFGSPTEDLNRRIRDATSVPAPFNIGEPGLQPSGANLPAADPVTQATGAP
jgi:hypothetical protein